MGTDGNDIAMHGGSLQRLETAVAEQIDAMAKATDLAQQVKENGAAAYIAQSYQTFATALNDWADDYQAITKIVNNVAHDLHLGAGLVLHGEGVAAGGAHRWGHDSVAKPGGGDVSARTFEALSPFRSDSEKHTFDTSERPRTRVEGILLQPASESHRVRVTGKEVPLERDEAIPSDSPPGERTLYTSERPWRWEALSPIQPALERDAGDPESVPEQEILEQNSYPGNRILYPGNRISYPGNRILYRPEPGPSS